VPTVGSAYANQLELIVSKAPHAKDLTKQRIRRNGKIDEVQRAKQRENEDPGPG
jgi:transposase, IS5 family